MNPTGGMLRNDSWGSGHFGASRGSRIHRGVDVTGIPGSYVVAPAAGRVVRSGYPYADDDGPWNCYLLIREPDGTEWRLFYVSPLPGVIGSDVVRGQVVAQLADVSEKYGDSRGGRRMLPHCHVEQIVNGKRIDPSPVILHGKAGATDA